MAVIFLNFHVSSLANSNPLKNNLTFGESINNSSTKSTLLFARYQPVTQYQTIKFIQYFDSNEQCIEISSSCLQILSLNFFLIYCCEKKKNLSSFLTYCQVQSAILSMPFCRVPILETFLIFSLFSFIAALPPLTKSQLFYDPMTHKAECNKTITIKSMM